MGNRANVILKSGDNEADLVLYTHWQGSEVEAIVRAGIAHALVTGRNFDASYGQRIVVDAFFRAHADDYERGTGAGIYSGSAYEPHVVTVDFDDQTVTFDPSCEEYGPESREVTESFEEFVVRFAPVAAEV